MKNTMRNMIALIVMVALVFAIAPLIVAEESATDESIIEDNPSLISANVVWTLDEATVAEVDEGLDESVTGWELGWEKFGLIFTFNQEKKANKELQIAKYELAKAKIAAENNDAKGLEQALENHQKYLDKVKNRLNSIESETGKDKIIESSEKIVGLERAIFVHEARIAKFNELIANSTLTDDEIAKIQAKIDKATEVTANLEQIQVEKKEQIKTKLITIGGMTEEEAAQKIEEIENSNDLSNVKQYIAVKEFRDAQKNVIEMKATISNKYKSGGSLTEEKEKLKKFQQKLSETNKKLESMK